MPNSRTSDRPTVSVSPSSTLAGPATSLGNSAACTDAVISSRNEESTHRGEPRLGLSTPSSRRLYYPLTDPSPTQKPSSTGHRR